MTHFVRLRRSGHRFPVEPSETLLDAALRAGISIDYGCSNGTCGDCRARLLEGTLGAIEPHDFPLGEAARQDGWFLPCRARAASDLLIDADETGQADDIPAQTITCKVAKIDQRGEGIAILSLRTPRSQTLRFLAGQRATLTLAGGEQATLPIASCPCNGLILEFHLFRDAASPFMARVFSTLRAGARITLNGPRGEFSLDDESPRAQLFLTYEAAFATTKSLIEHAISLDEDRPRRLIWLARDAACHYLHNLGRAWADSLDDFHFLPVLMAPDDWTHGIRVLANQAEEFTAADAYVCGPGALIDAARTRLAEHPAIAAAHFDAID